MSFTKRPWLWGIGALVAVFWLWSGTNKASSMDPQNNGQLNAQVRNPAKADAPAQAQLLALPEQLVRDTLEPAARDPFAYEAPPAPKLNQVVKKLPPAKPVEPMPVMAAPVPMAPSLDLRYTGRMVAPDGTVLVFATLAESPLTLVTGMSLPNGYRVERINDRAVEFSFPALGTTARLDLPEPPKYEIR
jgi:hypothetical protein